MARTKASNEAQYKYNSTHLKRIPLDVQISEYDLIKAYAAASGESVNGFAGAYPCLLMKNILLKLRGKIFKIITYQ